VMIEKAEEMFRVGIQKAHQKVEQLYEAVEEEDIRRREIVALSEGLKKKLGKMCDTLSGNITKLGSYMQSFSSQPT
jgi:coenzyme F420-reducing hydrogenase delta subunit